MILKVFLVLLSITTTTFATNLDGLKIRFDFVRENGQLKLIKAKGIKKEFRISPYIAFIKKALKDEQTLMNSKSENYISDVSETLFGPELLALESEEQKQRNIVIDSLLEIKSLDIEKIFSDPEFKNLVNKLEGRISSIFEKIDPSILANLNDTDFFYNKNISYQVLDWGLRIAKRSFSSLPLFNTASYVIVKVVDLLKQRRLYHQNMLLHYIENFSEDELNLTHKEVNHIFSSIYESRIQWFAFWESREANSDWDRFGTKRFYQRIRLANNNFRRVRNQYDSVGKRINFAYQNTTSNGERSVIDLFNTKHMFSTIPSTAINFENPNKIKRKRILLQISELGISFLPLPQFIKNIGENYINSMYVQQSITEGALFAHYETIDDKNRMKLLKKQYINPFDQLK